MEEEGSKAKESGSKSNLNPRTDGISSEVNSGPGLRGSLVDLAVKFLNNPRVFDKPLEDKKIFLTKKGSQSLVKSQLLLYLLQLEV